MPIPIQGPSGKTTQGTADTALIFITSWDADISQDVEVVGPFLNDSGNLYKSRTSRSLKGTMKGAVPSGKDASQTAIIAALTGGNDIKTTLVSYGGYSVVVAAALIDGVKLGHDAKGTATFEASFQDNGGFTVA
jgi:hypothetical protein